MAQLDWSLEQFTQAFSAIVECTAEQHSCSVKTLPESEREQQLRQLFFLIKEANRSGEERNAVTACDGFISDWEGSGRVSAAVQQLVRLLSRPHVKSVIAATAEVANGRFSPDLPSVPYEVDDDEGVAVTIVHLEKRAAEPVGATIKKDDKGRIVIARVLAGGVAERSGHIHEGDRLLEVNGNPVNGLDVTRVAGLLNEVDVGKVTMKLTPALPAPSSSAYSQVHLRALFDYDGPSDEMNPCPEAALSFRRGDILELLVCTDEHWWQARRLGHGALAGIRAVEPSNCSDSSTASGVGLVPSEALQMFRRTEGKKQGSRGTLRSRSSNESDEYPLACYEAVCCLKPSSFSAPSPSSSTSSSATPTRPTRKQQQRVRPIILLGAFRVGKNELKRRLLAAAPTRFSTPVPHTSRAARLGEQSGREYHFVTKQEMEKLIQMGELAEFGEFRGNLYGTALESITEAGKNGTPLLTPHPLAFRALRSHCFAPIIIFIRPPQKKEFLETREHYRGELLAQAGASTSTASAQSCHFTAAAVDSILADDAKLERTYGAVADAQVVNAHVNETVSKLLRLIDLLESSPTWVPLAWATKVIE